jgi:hypothetical protein
MYVHVSFNLQNVVLACLIFFLHEAELTMPVLPATHCFLEEQI